MSLDLEGELLRAAHMLHRDRADPALELTPAFATSDLVDVIVSSGLAAFPRLAHELLADQVPALASSLLELGFFERVDSTMYALTTKAVAYLEGEPWYLAKEDWHPSISTLTSRREGAG